MGCLLVAQPSHATCAGSAWEKEKKTMHIDMWGLWVGQHANGMIRASSLSAPTARSSVSRTVRPSRFSSSARTPAASHGPSFAGDRGGRVSLRCASTFCHLHYAMHCVHPVWRLTHYTGASQVPPSQAGQVPACRRWCISRCDQGAPLHAPRGSFRSPRRGDQGW